MSRLERMAAAVPTRMATVLAQLATLLIVVWAAFSLPAIRENTDANVRTDQLSACRSTFRGDIDAAALRVQEAFGEVQQANGAATLAVGRYDAAGLEAVAVTLTAANAHRDEAFDDLRAANDAYAEAVQASVDDPARFLTQCKETP